MSYNQSLPQLERRVVLLGGSETTAIPTGLYDGFYFEGIFSTYGLPGLRHPLRERDILVGVRNDDGVEYLVAQGTKHRFREEVGSIKVRNTTSAELMITVILYRGNLEMNGEDYFPNLQVPQPAGGTTLYDLGGEYGKTVSPKANDVKTFSVAGLVLGGAPTSIYDALTTVPGEGVGRSRLLRWSLCNNDAAAVRVDMYLNNVNYPFWSGFIPGESCMHEVYPTSPDLEYMRLAAPLGTVDLDVCLGYYLE